MSNPATEPAGQPGNPIPTVDAATLTEWLLDGDELAILDAREQGVYYRSHLFHAASLPLSKLELRLEPLVPRKDTRVVWCDADGADDGPAVAAASKAKAMGWTNGHRLSGGIEAWRTNGGELYGGVNVPSKAFGEHVEHVYDTPRIPATELKTMLDAGRDMVILDSRPMDEYRRMSIPTGVDCPGAELVHRVKEVAPNPDTVVVVNCAGRTRSIIGSQSLINAGLENRVVALENGTMGWHLAGLELASGFETHAPDPGPEATVWAKQAAADVGRRFGVETVSWSEVQRWKAEAGRTTYLFDVRTPEEFKAGHIPGSRNAPGGQLVQATDEYVATWNARLVLIDDTGVRATMTASWLRQLGWERAVVLDGGVAEAEAAGVGLVDGLVARATVPSVPTIKVSTLAKRLAEDGDGLAVLDVGTSVKYRNKGHIPGAWWGVRSRLDEARAAIGDVTTLVITSKDGHLAKLAAADATEHWPEAEILALAGGNKGWRHGKNEMEPGFTRATTEPDDVWYKPYDHNDGKAEQHMQDYLTWEIALVEQIARDRTVDFPRFD